MTLTTKIAIVEPTPVREVFDACRRLLSGEGVPFTHDLSTWKDGVTVYRNQAGAGLHALLWVEYGADAPLVPSPESADDPDERSYYPPVDQWSVVVYFDTTYGYRGDHGGSCDDLHAWLIRELGHWLSERGLTWLWNEEYNGEWHPSTDPVDAFGDPERGRLSDSPRLEACFR
jgi:hypothetical protein